MKRILIDIGLALGLIIIVWGILMVEYKKDKGFIHDILVDRMEKTEENKWKMKEKEKNSIEFLDKGLDRRMFVFQDPDTGVWYIGTVYGGLTYRTNIDGSLYTED